MARGIEWNWTGAAFGVALAMPAAIVALFDPESGLALATGMLPAALLGVLPRRRRRPLVVVLGALTGASIAVGGLLSGEPVLAVAAVFLLGVGFAQLAATRPRIGRVAMTLSLPMVGIGLSDDFDKALGIAGLMVAGSVYGLLVALPWPEREVLPPRPPAATPTLEYGIRLGAAGATAAAIGFALDLDHVGWATAAALLVMRPVADMQKLRSAGRIASVAVGASAAVLFIDADPAAGWYAAAAVAALAGATATRASRWYVTAGFSTYLVFLLLLYVQPETAGSRFAERLLETILGVAIAAVFGLMLPRLAAASRRPPAPRPRDEAGDPAAARARR